MDFIRVVVMFGCEVFLYEEVSFVGVDVVVEFGEGVERYDGREWFCVRGGELVFCVSKYVVYDIVVGVNLRYVDFFVL